MAILCLKPINILFCCVIVVGTASISNAQIVVAFGDSITAGRGSSSGGYPPKLQALLNSNGQSVSVLNYGRNGETTLSGVNRIDSVLAAQPTNYILLLEGTNDAQGGVSTQTVQHNLNVMINKSRAAGAVPLISTLTPDSRPEAQGKNIEGAYNPMIQSLASGTGTALVDQYSAVAPGWGSLTVDGLHPNDSGYQIMAETWNAVLPIGGGGGSTGGGGGGGPCFIATAAFGSILEPHVQLLTRFRDTYLLPNKPGRSFVDFYYTYSPPVADFIAESTLLKALVRLALYPLIGASYILLEVSFLSKVLLSITFFLFSALCYLVLKNRRVNGHLMKQKPF